MGVLFISLTFRGNDGKTIWLFREKLTTNGALKKLFKKFYHFLNKQDVIAKEERIVDATFVDVPKQRNNHDGNETLKSGKIL